MPVTKDQAAQLASLAAAIRPHGARRWDHTGIVAQIAKVQHLHLADVALAVIRAADDRDLETPGAIGNPAAPCWKERKTDRPQPVEPFNPTSTCGICGRTETHCRRNQHSGHTFINAVDDTRQARRHQETP